MKYFVVLSLLAVIGSGCSTNDATGKEGKAVAAPEATTPAAAVITPIDEKNGFRTFHFGDDSSRFPNLAPALFPEQDGIRIRSMKSGKENLKVGDAKLEEINYAFYHGKLYYIDLVTEGRDNLKKVTAAATSLYGAPAPTLSGNGVKWEGQQVEARTLSVERGGLAGGTTGYLRIKSKTIDNEVKAAQANADKKASSDL